MIRRYSGRDFTEIELETIRQIIQENPKKHRKFLSEVVCKQLHWLKPNGGLKDMSCRVAMLKMAKDELIVLPAPRRSNVNGKKNIERTAFAAPRSSLHIDSLEALQVTLVETKVDSLLWNEFIDRYHYLGFKPLPGAQLRYFVKSESEFLAFLGFGAAAWKVGPRDKWIGWSQQQREKNLPLVINNARFLILPWVLRKNLASKILSLISKRIVGDWLRRYNYSPVLLETFVEAQRFRGTCYKASNWINVGLTQGRGKLDRYHQSNIPVKSIWLYSLSKSFRKRLVE